MKTCQYLLPDDYECNDIAPIKIGTRHYCQHHAKIVEGDAVPIDEYDFEDEEKGYYIC